MLLNYISNEEMAAIDCYRNYYAYRGEENLSRGKASMNYVLRFWNENKGTLFQLLGKSLMCSKNICIKAPTDYLENSMSELLAHNPFCDWFYDLSWKIYEEDWQMRNHLNTLLNCEYLVRNKWRGDYTDTIKFEINGKVIAAQPGCKPLRILAKIAALYGKEELFEQFRLEHSRILNKKDLHGELVLSIHPLDYMTMSDNDSGWSSCMSWQESGCYRRGTVEMMNSEYVVVAYLKGEKDMSFGPFTWNNKKWRELFVVTGNFITNIKAYPYKSDDLTKEALTMIAELAKANLGWDYGETVEYVPFNRFTHEEKDYVFNFETEAMYNDFESVDYCFIKMMPNLPSDRYYTCYSGEGNCMHCGELGEYDSYEDYEGNLICEDCAPCYRCYECGDRIYEGEMYEVDDELLCEYCYERHTERAVDDDELHLMGNLTSIYLVANEVAISYDAQTIHVYELHNPDESFLEKYFPGLEGQYRRETSGWRDRYYVLVDDCSPAGLELFGLDPEDKEEIDEYRIAYSLSHEDRDDRARAIRNGEEWPRKEKLEEKIFSENLNKLYKKLGSFPAFISDEMTGMFILATEED